MSNPEAVPVNVKQSWWKNPGHICFFIFSLYALATLIYSFVVEGTRLFDKFFPKAYSKEFGILLLCAMIGVVICYFSFLFVLTRCGECCSLFLKIVSIIGFLITVAFYLSVGFLAKAKDIEKTMKEKLTNYSNANPTANETTWFLQKTSNLQEDKLLKYVKSHSTSMGNEVLGIYTAFCAFALFILIYALCCGPDSPCGPQYKKFREAQRTV